MMMKSFKFLAAAAILAATVSCASIEKMAQMAENVKVSSDPGVLEAANGDIDAVVAVTYPADYFNPKAILEVTPVLVYEGGEAAMKPFIYQGEKVKDNYKVVSSDGQTVREKVHFNYVPGMEKSHLELRGVARKGEKFVNLPVKKVADGVNTTYMLVKRDGFVTPKADAYQDVISSTAEGQIKYLVNSADVRNSELKGKSVKDFLAAIDQINADARTTIKGTEILAYASPEGPERKNNELADKRSASANKALKEMGKKHENLAGAEGSPTSKTRSSSSASSPCTATRPSARTRSATCPRCSPPSRVRSSRNSAAPVSSPTSSTRTTPPRNSSSSSTTMPMSWMRKPSSAPPPS